MFRKTYFKKRILVAGPTIQSISLFLLSRKRVNKTVGLLRKLQNVLPRTSKLLIRPYLDHGDMIHDQAYNFSFHQKLESFQYNASLAVPGPYGELPEKNSRRWYRELCCVIMIYNSNSSACLLISILSK